MIDISNGKFKLGNLNNISNSENDFVPYNAGLVAYSPSIESMGDMSM